MTLHGLSNLSPLKGILYAASNRGYSICYRNHKVVCYFDWQTAKIAQMEGSEPEVELPPSGSAVCYDPGRFHFTNQNLFPLVL